MLERISIVFHKEVLDHLRDWRTLAGALFAPLLGPLLMLALVSVLGRVFAEQSEKPLRLPVAGAANAPHLVTYLQRQNVEILPAPADPEAEVRAGNYDVVLVIPEEYGDDFSAGRPARVRLVLDDSRQSAGLSISRASRLLNTYSEQTGAQRLLARGVSPDLGKALAIERVDVSTPQSQAALFLNVLPFFVIFSVFIGGVYIAIDATAGERERESLEPLVINPVARSELVLGKLAATLVFTLVSVAETLIGFAVVLNLASLEGLGLNASLDPLAFAAIFVVTLPMMPLAAALQLLIATFTRSFKEAQNYLSFLPLIPALPGIFLAFAPVKPALWTMLIPTFGQQLLINQLMRGESVALLNVSAASIVAFAAGAALTFITIRLYEREQVLFGR